jgi:hypothetical protein
MALRETLTDAITKERGGRHGGKGHEFQRYWALCHLLHLDMERADYILILEFIEDVAVVNSSTDDPTEICLFQIKKREGAISPRWTKAALSNPQKDGLSVLARLCQSLQVSPIAKTSVAFVSNAPVDFPLANGMSSIDRAQFSASEVDLKLHAELKQSIANELNCDEAKIDLSSLAFIKSTLAMDDMENHAVGIVAAYFAKKFPAHTARADVFCRALYGELKIRATSTQHADTFEQLCTLRGVAKSQFDQMLTTTIGKKPDSAIVETALSTLVQENVPFGEIRKLKQASREFLIHKAGNGNATLASLEQDIETCLCKMPDTLEKSWDAANWIEREISSQGNAKEFSMLDKSYLLAVILYKINQ